VPSRTLRCALGLRDLGVWQFTDVEARIAITVTLGRHAGIGRGTLLTL
jgi:hypothetical protein